MTQYEDPQRADLSAWESARPANVFEATPNLGRVLRAHLDPTGLTAIETRLRSFGRTVAQVVEPAAATLERHRTLPAHTAFDGIGKRVERIEFHPAYHDAGRAIWRSGIAGLAPDPGAAFEQAALLYLLAYSGEGGHACPVVCTAGLVRALRRHGPPELRDRFLPALLETDYDRCHRGAQFLTEVQGGSDVGANLTRAVPAADGAWRISGEKWFCSVADADQFVVTARVGDQAGTRGLGCFLVPRRLDDGKLNGFAIRRLKDKLGTRALASAEIDFEDAIGWPIGAVEDGFRIAAGVVLNTSRWLNALGSAGIMRRAYLEAAGYARHRRAFGRTIGSFPLVRENLAVMKASEHAALASSMELTALVDRIDRDDAGADDVAFHRVLVNANKYLTSIDATGVVHRAIEVLGGNGTIEDFSPLPRLYRDAIVFESWEGTHNVLSEQVRRDLGRLDLLEPVLTRLRERLKSSAEGDRAAVVASVDAALDTLEPGLRRSTTDEAYGALHFRRHLGTLTRIVQAVALLGEAEQPSPGEKPDVATLFVRRHLVAGYDPSTDPSYASLVDAVLAEDL